MSTSRCRAPCLSSIVFLLLASAAFGQDVPDVTIDDYRKLRINEIVPDNASQGPTNCFCRHVDMVEIYNGSDKDLPLAGPFGQVQITPGVQLPKCADPLCNRMFLDQIFIGAGERLLVFFDGANRANCLQRVARCRDKRDARALDDFAEIHAPLTLDADGRCITLGLYASESESEILHQVAYPPLTDDIAYVRFPEDVENLDNWIDTERATLGVCESTSSLERAACHGASNGEAALSELDIRLIDYSSLNPSSGEPLALRVRVVDDKPSTPENVEAVEIHYRVGDGEESVVPMSFLENLFLDRECLSDDWSIWEGAIPPQAAGSVVEFWFVGRDADGNATSAPGGDLCEPGVGPCDPGDTRGPGPGCAADSNCAAPFRYVVGSTYDGPLAINEIVPRNDGLFPDTTNVPCIPADCEFDDFIELCNGGDATVNLEGLALTRRPFEPGRWWVFPPGSSIEPGQHLVVWLDGAGVEPVDEFDRENPNDPAGGEYHTDFRVDASVDQVYLLDTGEKNRQVIDGTGWGRPTHYLDSELTPLTRDRGERSEFRIDPDSSLARVVDCDRSSRFVELPDDSVSPGEANTIPDEFRRGDASLDGVVNLSDAVLVLVYLFSGGAAPSCLDAADADDNGEVALTDPVGILTHLFLAGTIPAPGSMQCGPDPTDDTLPVCVDPECIAPAE